MKRKKSLTLIGAIRKYKKQRKKITRGLSDHDRITLENQLRPLEDELRKYNKISKITSALQILLGVYMGGDFAVTKNFNVQAASGIGGLQVTKVNNSYHARKTLRQAYAVLEKYNHIKILDDYGISIVTLPEEEYLH